MDEGRGGRATLSAVVDCVSAVFLRLVFEGMAKLFNRASEPAAFADSYLLIPLPIGEASWLPERLLRLVFLL